jgi:hypothetical protein
MAAKKTPSPTQSHQTVKQLATKGDGRCSVKSARILANLKEALLSHQTVKQLATKKRILANFKLNLKDAVRSDKQKDHLSVRYTGPLRYIFYLYK